MDWQRFTWPYSFVGCEQGKRRTEYGVSLLSTKEEKSAFCDPQFRLKVARNGLAEINLAQQV